MAVPTAAAFDTVRKLLELTAEFGEGSFLLVLKLFGDEPSPGVLSFPLPGATLALDFPNKGESTRRLLDRMADVVLAAGGRLYPAKDATMSGAAFRAGYPDWRKVEAQRDPNDHVGLLAPRDRGGRMSDPRSRRDVRDRAGLRAAPRRAGLRFHPRGAARGPACGDCGRPQGLRRGERRDRSRSISPRWTGSRRACDDMRTRFGAPDEVVIAYGVLGEQAAAEQDLAQARALIDTNFTSAALWILALLKDKPANDAPSPSSASARSRATAAAAAISSTAPPRPASTASSKGCAQACTAPRCASSA